MLKHIPKIFTPDLLKLLMQTGHGDEILIADGNFPHKNSSREIIYIPVCDISELLKDILRFFPLDSAVEYAAFAMEVLKENVKYEDYKNLIEKNGSKLQLVERFAFYNLAENASGIIVTADTTRGGNILIKKGVVKTEDTID